MLVRDKIKALRKDLHITSVELAEMIGVTQATISRYENGYVKIIPDDVLIKIADVLHTSIDDLTIDDPAYLHLHKDSYKKSKRSARNNTDKKLLEWYHKQSPEIQSFIQQIIYSDTASL